MAASMLLRRSVWLRTAFSRLSPQPARCRITAPELAGGYPWRQWAKAEPTDDLKSFDEIKAELEAENNARKDPVDIGKPWVPPSIPRTEAMERTLANRKNNELEKAARHETLTIPLEEVQEDWWRELGQSHMRTLVEHYGIYEHLFDGADFTPTLRLRCTYDLDEEYVIPVHLGNHILPQEAKEAPNVEYEAEAGSLHTLLLTNPDGHFTDNTKEYIHWMLGNIPAGDLQSGELLCDYLPPFPPRGTGSHRHVFVLYEQDGKIDFSAEKKHTENADLESRTFSTVEFFDVHREHLTPVGISMFQSEYDDSVKDTYHNVLDMLEPSYEFIHPPPYHPRQVMYPDRQPFDRYYDRYRDKKDIREEVLKMKLELIKPFEKYTPKHKYPILHIDEKEATWLKRRKELIYRRQEQYKDLPK